MGHESSREQAANEPRDALRDELQDELQDAPENATDRRQQDRPEDRPQDTGRLLRAAAGGDQAAWDVLVERFSSLLWSVARAYRLEPTDAADAVQTTWLRLVEHLDRIDEPEALPGWLATTARRECLRVLRRADRERFVADDSVLGALADPGEPLETGLLTAERDAALWRLFRSLPERCQRLLRVLMASPPPAYAAVAAALDMPVGSIGPTRQRCLEQLRRLAATDAALADVPAWGVG